MAEQPLYFPLIFATDQVRREAVVNPTRKDDAAWKGDAVIQSILTGDNAAAIPMGSERLLARLFPGLGTDQFTSLARGWLKQARHPRFNRPYDQLVYTPMLELHRYLKEHGFSIYICSGAGEEWVRSFSETAYELPPERVLGTVTKLKFVQSIDGAGLVREPELLYRCDGPGKPIAIQQRLGRRPVLAFGNSDGDLEMLQFVSGQSRPHLCLLLHHDDGDREYAYDRESKVGRLDKAWNEALSQGWAIVSMKNDWSRVFAAPGE